MKSLRTVYLTLLTLVCYALINFLQHKILLFPLPANDFISLIILLYLFFIEKSARKQATFILLYVGFHFLQNPYNYELFLSTEKIEFLNQIYFFDITQLISYLMVCVYIVIQFLANRIKKINLLLVFAFLFIGASLFFHDFMHNFLQLFSFVALFAFFSLKNNKLAETERIYLPQAFWLLSSGLKLSLIITLYFVS